MTRMLTLLPGLLVPSALAAQAVGGAGPAPREADAVAIRQVIATYFQTWNRHDMDAWGRLFTDDVDYVNRGGGWWRTNRDNVAGHRAIHDGIVRRGERMGLDGRVAELAFLAHDVALVHVETRMIALGEESEASDRAPGAGRWTPGAIMTVVMTRGADGWRIRALQNTLVEQARRDPERRTDGPPSGGGGERR